VSRALVLIDIQNDYFPGGALPLVGSDAAGLQAGRLLEHFRATAQPIVHIQHLSVRPGSTFFVPDTPGADIHACVAPRSGETVIRKHFPNSFRDTTLHAHLQGLGIRQLVVAGMMTHMCIDTTVRAAFDLGYSCQLAHDACATRDLEFAGVTTPAAQVHAAFIAALNGLFARVQSSADVLAA
jgi:nicotinamidase-related amidase